MFEYVVFAPSTRTPSKAWSCSPGFPVRDFTWKQRDLPGSRKFSILIRLVPKTPAESSIQTITDFRCCPRPTQTRRLQQNIVFRGSIATHLSSLSTLHRGGYPTPCKTRFRRWVKPYRTGSSRKNLTKGFNMLDFAWLSSFLQTSRRNVPTDEKQKCQRKSGQIDGLRR